jgi:hypothetical protein
VKSGVVRRASAASQRVDREGRRLYRALSAARNKIGDGHEFGLRELYSAHNQRQDLQIRPIVGLDSPIGVTDDDAGLVKSIFRAGHGTQRSARWCLVKDFDLPLPLDQVAEGYRAMDERRAIKALLRP